MAGKELRRKLLMLLSALDSARIPYLTFTAQASNSTLRLDKVGDESLLTASLMYSLDNGDTWSNYTWSILDGHTGYTITLQNIGDTVMFKGSNNSFSVSTANYYQFIMSGTIAASGSVNTLLNETINPNAVPSYSFCSLFLSCTSLVSAPELPATTLANGCYQRMFCYTSLVTAPTLPATTLAEECYEYMFMGCTSLVTAPTLPATTLAQRCYRGMFYECYSLIAAPSLPATTLTRECYAVMFCECRSLTTAPDLPATTLVEECYAGMFDECTSLNSVKLHATDISATNCLTNWLSSVASTGELWCDPNLSIPTGVSGIPAGWTRLTLQGYVQDGLVLDMDGVQQGGTSLVWTSLVGGHVFTPYSGGGVTFNQDYVEFDGTSGRLTNNTFTTPNTGDGTIEAVYERNGATVGILYSTSRPSGVSKRLMFGINSTGNLSWTNISSSPRYPVPMSASVSVSDNGCFANGSSVTSNGNDYWSSGNTSYNRIGCRYNSGSNTTFFNGKIYCIRIYNRKLTQAEVLHNYAVDQQRFSFLQNA